MLLWLDDLQWGGAALDFLEALVEGGEGPSALVLATLRSDIVADRAGLAERLEALETRAGADRIALASLSTTSGGRGASRT